MHSVLELFERKTLPVIPLFEPLYKRVEKIDLKLTENMGDANEVRGMLDEVSNDCDFRALTQTTQRRIVTYIDLFHNLNVDREGNFYILTHGHDPAGFDITNEERNLDLILSESFPHQINAANIRNGLLDYVRFAPYNDLYSTHLNDSR